MENQNSATKTMLTYGLYLGVAGIIVSLANYSFGNPYKPHWIVNVINLVLMIALIYVGIKAFKNSNDGFLKLGQAIKIGLGIALVSGILGVIYYFIFSKIIEPEFTEKLIEFSEQAMLEKNPEMSEEQAEMGLGMIKKFTSPGIILAMTLGMSLFFGLIISLITGSIMKKDKNEY